MTKYHETIPATSFIWCKGDISVHRNGEVLNGGVHARRVVLTGAIHKRYVTIGKPKDKIDDFHQTIPAGADQISWKFSVPQTGNYRLSFRYNNPGGQMGGSRNLRDERNCRVLIDAPDFYGETGWAGWMIFNVSGYNGLQKSDAKQSIETVAGNTNWNHNFMNVHLSSGQHVLTIGIQAPPGQAVYAGPNLDQIEIESWSDILQDVPEKQSSFVHPGIYLTDATIANLRTLVTDSVSIVNTGYAELVESPLAQADYHPVPQRILDVGPYNNPNIGGNEWSQDNRAAFYQAVRWVIEGDVVYARNAIKILDGWVDTLQAVAKGNDLKLRLALVGTGFINTAEILKTVYNPVALPENQWSQVSQSNFEAFLRKFILHKTLSYYPANCKNKLATPWHDTVR